MNIALRISESYDDLKAFCDLIETCSDKVIVYEHQAARKHIHALLINCKVSTDTLKNYVKRTLSVTTYPKSDWSFKTLYDNKPVDDNFIIYMSKGNLQPVHVKGYIESDIEHYKSQWVDIAPKRKKEMTQYKLKLENPREAKIRQNELMDMVKQRVHESGLSQPRQVLEIIRQVVYIEHRTIVGRYKMRDFYDYVMADVAPTKWLDDMLKIISFKEL